MYINKPSCHSYNCFILFYSILYFCFMSLCLAFLFCIQPYIVGPFEARKVSSLSSEPYFSTSFFLFLAYDVNWPSLIYHVSERPAFTTTLMMESAVSSKMWINFYQTVRRRIPKDVSLKLYLKLRKRTRCFVPFIVCHNEEHRSWGLGTSENTSVVSKHFCPQPLNPWCVIIWAVGEMKVSSLNVHTD